MADLVDTTEMYLRTILDLEEEGIVPLRARISERLGHSGPTVSQTIARMERDGLVEVAEDRRLVLTVEGRGKAVRVLRKHRIAEGLLANLIGLDLAMVHDEACRWEHVMSDAAERRIFDLLGRPTESPYGTPIPGLEEFDVEPSAGFLEHVTPITEVMSEGTDVFTVRRLGEPVQADHALLELLRAEGVLPGVRVTLGERSRDRVALFVEGRSTGVELPTAAAAHIYVDAE